MRAWFSDQPERAAQRWPLVIAAAYLLIHLPLLAPSLEDIDSINFALGLRQFDVALHQPHPPGYPVYIALGRVSFWLLSGLTRLSPAHLDAAALALWSAIGGAVALLGATRLWAAVDARWGAQTDRPVWSGALLAVAPLFWMSGLRPMSDMPGLAAVLWSQALLVEGISSGGACVAGALVAGLAGGIRIQTLALTTPLLLVALVAQWRKGGWRGGFRPVLALGIGVAAWAVPLAVASGGLQAYLAALGTQAGEDFAWVNMLWTEPTARRASIALYETFALPWALPGLARVVGVASLIGLVRTAVRTPRALFIMATAFVPYGVYHLLFQETFTVRYALPLLPGVVWLACQGAGAAGRFAPAIQGLLVAAGLTVAFPGGLVYAQEAHPAFRAIEDATVRLAVERPARVFAHFGLRRPLQHRAAAALPFVEPRRQYEWLDAVDYWKRGGRGTVWFFADPIRTDLALIDPMSRREVQRYAWAARTRPELSGVRPLGTDWYRIREPEWFAGEGWSLTPETGGMAHATGGGPDRRAIEAGVRRGPDARQLVIGGVFLGDASAPQAELTLKLDGAVVAQWGLSTAERLFLRFLSLPSGIGDGPGRYARLTVESHVPGRATASPEVAIQQFDVQPVSRVVMGFAEGWHEPEYAPATGQQWRWTSERAVLRLRGMPQRTVLTLRGESPLRYVPAAPMVVVSAGGRTLDTFQPADDFTREITVPEEIWQDGEAVIVITTDRVYLPGPAEGTSDERRLGLRLFDTQINTRLP